MAKSTTKAERDKLREKQIAKAQRMINEGKGPSEIGRALGVVPGTIHSWLKKGALGPKGTPVPEPNLKLPPIPKINDPIIIRQMEKMADPAIFAQNVADGYKSLWFTVKKYLDNYLEGGGGEKGVQPKDVKDWVEVLQKLGTHVETYEATNKPAHTVDEAEMAQQLRERNRTMRALYEKEESA